MRFYDALENTLGSVGENDWKAKLDALHEETGSWKETAQRLGADTRTVERWRYGYRDKRGNRKNISPATIRKSVVPKIRKVFQGDHGAQVRMANWSSLSVKGTILIGGGKYKRTENMRLGQWFEDGTMYRIAQAYKAGDRDATQRAVDTGMSFDYIRDGATVLADVITLDI